MYTKLLVYATILLTYSKGYMFSIRLTYVKHAIVTSFLLEASTAFYCDMWSCDCVTVTVIYDYDQCITSNYVV